MNMSSIKTRDGQIQLAALQPRGQLLISSTLQNHEEVQQCAPQNVLIDSVGLKIRNLSSRKRS